MCCVGKSTFLLQIQEELLSGEIATYLTGRFYTIEILTLSYKEVSEGFSKNEDIFSCDHHECS